MLGSLRRQQPLDPIAHTLVGASLAQTGLGRKTLYGTAALIIGVNLPDVDAATMLVGSDHALFWRRGWTHGIPALVVLPLLMTGLFVAWTRFKNRAPEGRPLRPAILLCLSTIAVASHPTLDWMNNYGMRWLMPFRNEWSYGDTLFIIDPWMWLVLGGAVFLYQSRRLSSLVGWAAFAGLTGLVLFGSFPGLRVGKILWCAGLGTLVLLRFYRVGRQETGARRLAVGAVVLVTVYIGLMLLCAQYARTAVAGALTARGIQIQKLMVGPVPVNPFVRDVVVETLDGYRYGEARLLPRFELELASRSLPLLADSRAVRLATASPEVRGFMNWARFPSAEVEESASGVTVYLLDARYTRSMRPGFGTAQVHISRRF
jgi:inner membrane protein